MAESKSFLVLNRRPPYSSNFAKEALDVALMCAVFNQNTSILYMDDGVFQLVREQDPADIQQKNSSQTLPMLEMYEVKHVYVDAESLLQRGLQKEDLVIPVELVDSPKITQLLSQQQVILNF
ncbi:MAG: sulfurtransferase complex subunit TusC [Pseudomonadales bacterium]|nr:sulfurtransferase complex subunit TusC [Pseudomonadales bacterium]MCP5214949.1 sulfurtransferase complex subunit TusC [Pseudomonadales bacterium]